jgi:uroporphyrinogen-III synthase
VRPRLLVTRAQPGASATAAGILALRGEALVCPLFEIVRTSAPLPSFAGVQAVAFTSAHAVRAAVGAPLDLPAFAVGAGTAKAASAAGFSTVYSADGDGAALAGLLAARLKPVAGAIAHLRGEDAAFDLATALSAKAFSVRSAVLYRSVEAKSLTADQEALVQRASGVLLHSPRGAAAAARLFATFAPQLSAFCISAATAVTAQSAAFKDFKVAQRPHEEALLACAFAQSDAKG